MTNKIKENKYSRKAKKDYYKVISVDCNNDIVCIYGQRKTREKAMLLAKINGSKDHNVLIFDDQGKCIYKESRV